MPFSIATMWLPSTFTSISFQSVGRITCSCSGAGHAIHWRPSPYKPPVWWLMVAIDFELHALADVDRAGCEFGVKVDAAVAVGFALESEREPEVFVLLLGPEIAVGVA